MQQYDVVVIGDGIAGSAVAARLAAADLTVLVLERQVTYRDKVRGEYMHLWGVVEAQRLGLEQTLLDAGGSYATEFVSFNEDVDPTVALESALPLGAFLPEVTGRCVSAIHRRRRRSTPWPSDRARAWCAVSVTSR